MGPLPQRPDQRAIAGGGGVSGSRSGAGELAGALGYPGVPSAVPNCQGVSLFQQNVSRPTLYTFTGAGRIWLVILTYTITSNNGFPVAGQQPTVRTVAALQATLNPLTLAAVQLGIAGPSQHAEGTVAVPYPGLPVVSGESLVLSVGNVGVVPAVDQQATVSMLYSIP